MLRLSPPAAAGGASGDRGALRAAAAAGAAPGVDLLWGARVRQEGRISALLAAAAWLLEPKIRDVLQRLLSVNDALLELAEAERSAAVHVVLRKKAADAGIWELETKVVEADTEVIESACVSGGGG